MIWISKPQNNKFFDAQLLKVSPPQPNPQPLSKNNIFSVLDYEIFFHIFHFLPFLGVLCRFHPTLFPNQQRYCAIFAHSFMKNCKPVGRNEILIFWKNYDFKCTWRWTPFSKLSTHCTDLAPSPPPSSKRYNYRPTQTGLKDKLTDT